jgi:hypothetical protein
LTIAGRQEILQKTGGPEDAGTFAGPDHNSNLGVRIMAIKSLPQKSVLDVSEFSPHSSLSSWAYFLKQNHPIIPIDNVQRGC